MKHEALLTYIAAHPHHAYIVRGTFPEATHILERASRRIYLIERDIVRIEDVRALRAQTSRVNEAAIIIILRAQTILIEAQNALLKALEEPADGLCYIIHVRAPHTLLSTLVSRCHSIDCEDEHIIGHAEKFLSLSLPKRLEYITQAVASDGHGDAHALMESLIRCKHETTRQRETLLNATIAINRHPIGLRQILEHFALTL